MIHQLGEKFKFIDRQKICIWGWSYGGYVTGLIMAQVGLEQSDQISCGISVSPVTQWLHYDTAYTERYMGLPTQQHNARGYILSSLLQVRVLNSHWSRSIQILCSDWWNLTRHVYARSMP